MKISPVFRSLIILLIVMCNVGCDQISKTIVRNKISYNENIRLVNNHLTLTKVENTGAFLSVGNSLPFFIKFILLSLLPILIMVYGLYYLLTKKDISKLLMVGLCFIIGGGIGNLYDRLMYGSVTDFLHIDFIIFQTGIFNMADVSIMIGTGLILIELYLKRSDTPAGQNLTISS